MTQKQAQHTKSSPSAQGASLAVLPEGVWEIECRACGAGSGFLCQRRDGSLRPATLPHPRRRLDAQASSSS